MEFTIISMEPQKFEFMHTLQQMSYLKMDMQTLSLEDGVLNIERGNLYSYLMFLHIKYNLFY